jgi:hypothetical protein
MQLSAVHLIPPARKQKYQREDHSSSHAYKILRYPRELSLFQHCVCVVTG